MNKIRALIVDDSALVRQLLTEILNSDPSIEVVGSAPDPYIAREKIKKLNPDVLTLDVEMPRMDGITFLRNLMRLRPMPVLMVSSLTEQGADMTFQALEIGAIDFVSKPKVDVAHSLEQYSEEIIEKVKTAARARIHTRPAAAAPIQVQPKLSADAVLESHQRMHLKTTERVIAIGASTGGTEAIKDILAHMPADSPGIVITQHMPEAFTASFAQRMDSLSPMVVREAKDGDQIFSGHAFIAPGNRHLLVARSGARYICKINDGPPVNRHRPSVDVLFRSVADNVGPNGVGVILTGMGDDGAQGMREMHEAGIPTFAQDEKTSVVWGMPGSAVKLGAIDEVLPLERISTRILAIAAGNNK
jgi:two-component system, chemotaxis family, protein-glutamate methylesterase/glutaminase